ncbi:MAG: DEAD/DEAH box helicase, partial [Roseibacillus sp.]|nr:DEAD/DEAH box helicase [Roseibacillus sp.]
MPDWDYPDLPVSRRREEILDAMRSSRVVVVVGETGSGKTTQLPKMALELAQERLAGGPGLRAGRIGCTQPRRLAATSVARRVAEEMQVVEGSLVGYQVRFAEKVSEATAIKFMTDGILLAETQGDRALRQYDTLIIDEAHERSLNIDFLLGYLRRLLEKRKDLHLVISSATLDAGKFSEFYGNAPVVQVEGRTYPVEDHFLPGSEDEELRHHVLRAVEWITEMDGRG